MDNSYFLPDGSLRCQKFKDLCQCTLKKHHTTNHKMILPNGSVKEYPLVQPEQKEKLSTFF